MKTVFCLLILMVSKLVQAEILNCSIYLNTEKILSSSVTSLKQEKVSIGKIEGISAYVTEKEHQHFLVESFIGAEDLRFYAQGKINQSSDSIIASHWSRESLIEINCQKP